MKVAIFKGAKVGATTGFISALGYAVMALIIAELFLPIPNPTAIVIIDDVFLLSEIVIPTSPFWLFGSTVIGGITAVGFVVYLHKVNPSKKRFVTVCTFACTVITAPLLLLSSTSVIYATYFNGVYHPFINPLVDNLLEVGFPCMVYILAGLFTSNYLYKDA